MNTDEIVKPIFIKGLLKTVEWYRSESPHYLKSVFNYVGFSETENEPYWTIPSGLPGNLQFPTANIASPRLVAAKKESLHQIESKYFGFSVDFLNTLCGNQLYYLLEKFGGNIPLDNSENDDHQALFDVYKVKATKKIINFNRSEFRHLEDNLLIQLDISGIQPFIYNIVSDNALKNLRSRSFFIELLCNHAISKILSMLHLHRSNVIMNGGGTVWILSSMPENYQSIIERAVGYPLNKWLLEQFNGRLYTAFSTISCNDAELGTNLSDILHNSGKEMFRQKMMKYKKLIENDDFVFYKEGDQGSDPRYPGCEICQKDDEDIVSQGDQDRCHFCNRLIRLGNDIQKAQFIYEVEKEVEKTIQIEDSFYLLSDQPVSGLCPISIANIDGFDFFQQIGDLTHFSHSLNYTRTNQDLSKLPKAKNELEGQVRLFKERLEKADEPEEHTRLEEDLNSLNLENTATLGLVAKCSKGAELIGALRMDGDNMGKLFHFGIKNTSLERLSSFSRKVNDFFKIHLNSLCKNGKVENEAGEGKNVQVIYAGGDDLFIIGAWNEVAELSTEIFDAFNRFCCGNRDIGLSGGLTLHSPKFPVSQMAFLSKKALSRAKKNYQTCWQCVELWRNCPLYKDGRCMRKDALTLFFTEQMATRKSKIEQKLGRPKYSQQPPRLRLTLKGKYFQKKSVGSKETIFNEVDEYLLKPLALFRMSAENGLNYGFFQHAARLLDSWLDDGLIYLPRVAWLLQKHQHFLRMHHLKEDLDMGDIKSLYECFNLVLRVYEGGKRYSTLHLPLSWIMLERKGA